MVPAGVCNEFTVGKKLENREGLEQSFFIAITSPQKRNLSPE